jgi:hypothetical protein
MEAFESYGQELFAFLVGVLGSEADAQEVFSQVTEDLWRACRNSALEDRREGWLALAPRIARSG